MKKQLFFGAIVSLLLASCTNELDVPVNEALGVGNTPLSINVVANPVTKALVSGAVLPNNSQIGVKLVDAGGSTYDSQTFNNIFYSTTDGNTWDIDGTKSILLSATEGTAYAYYPYSDGVSDFKAISISSASNPNDQTDYMFGSVQSGLKNSNPTASFTMRHAMAIVNFEIAKGSYTGTGSITSVKMKGNTASNTGTMNAEAGTVTATNKGYEFESTNSLTLGSASGKFIVVPSGESSKLDFKLVMDGQTYTASTTTAVTLASGQVYKYTLTMNSTGLTVNTVTVTPWGTEQNQGSLDTELLNPWTIASDGVYAIDNAGNPVDYATANASSETYQGVALVMNGKAFEIAPTDASTSSKWAAASPMTEAEQAQFSSNYITKATENISWGYLKKPDGTYYSSSTASNQIPDDISTWTGSCALADLDGKANTDRIIAAGVTIANVINSYNDGSHGSTNWYLPAAGQLAYMYMNYDKINNLLPKVSGTALSTSFSYWSSSVFSANRAWAVAFLNGGVDGTSVTVAFLVRLVRDL